MRGSLSSAQELERAPGEWKLLAGPSPGKEVIELEQFRDLHQPQLVLGATWRGARCRSG